MRRAPLLLFVLACGKSSPATPPGKPAEAKIDAAPPPKPVPDVKAYAQAIADFHACPADPPCVDGAVERALAIWPESPAMNLLKGRRLANVADAVPFAKRALEAADRDDRIRALELTAEALEKTGDRDGAVAAYVERLGLRSDYKMLKHVEELTGKPLPLQRAGASAFRLGGPFPSLDFYCQALAAENPSQYGGTHCVPRCSGVDEGPAKASGGGWNVELLATIREDDAFSGTPVSCDLAIGNASGWYVLREAASCAPCGHEPFPATTPLEQIVADPKLKGRGNYDNAPRHDAAVSEELTFRDVVPGGALELVWQMRSRSIWVGAYDEDHNDITRDDTRVAVVCGLGASGRWSCMPPVTTSSDEEMVVLGRNAPKPERKTSQTPLKLEGLTFP